MGIEERVEATVKNVEGKAKELMGEATGDPKDKAEGHADQVEAKAQHAKEDVKGEIKKQLD